MGPGWQYPLLSLIHIYYPLYLLSGQTVWQLFTGATSAAMTVMVDNRVMLTRVKFPMAIFPIARVYSALVNFLYTFVAYLLMLLAFRIRPGITMLAAPAVILCVTLFSLGTVSYTQRKRPKKSRYAIPVKPWRFL